MSYRIEDLVRQATTTAGTGDLTLGAALDGYFTFADSLVDLDHLVYEVHAIDASGARIGQFETGIGQFWLDGATPRLRRAWPLTNSAGTAPAPLSFSAGTKHVYITVAAAQAKGLKIHNDGQGGTPTLYVRAGGSDNNAGFGPGTDAAFATIEHAVDVALDCFSRVNIDVGAGTFGDIFIDPNMGYRCDLTVVGAGRSATTIGAVFVGPGTPLQLFDFTFSHATQVALTAVGAGAYVNLGLFSEAENTLAFGACPAGHVLAGRGAHVRLGDYHISGGCSGGAHIVADSRGLVEIIGEQTLDANVAFANGFVKAGSLACVMVDNSFDLSGHTVTGKRYDVAGNAVVDTGGLGATHLPGSIAGTEASGGKYL